MVIVQNKIKTMPLMTEFILILSFANNIFIISEVVINECLRYMTKVQMEYQISDIRLSISVVKQELTNKAISD